MFGRQSGQVRIEMCFVLRSWICAASVFMTQYYFPLSQDSCRIDPIYSKLPLLHFYIRDCFEKTTVLFVVWAGQRIKPFGIIFCFLWTTNSTVFLLVFLLGHIRKATAGSSLISFLVIFYIAYTRDFYPISLQTTLF